MDDTPKNVLGGPLEPCSMKPLTGFYRTGDCNTGTEDQGCHAVCTLVTEELIWMDPGTVWATDFTEAPVLIDGQFEQLMLSRDLASRQQLRQAASAIACPYS